MKIRDELIGREVLDSTGHKIGEVDDIDVDFEGDRIDAIIIGEGKLIGRGRERIIPFNMIETVGERVILKKGSSEREMGEKGTMRDKPIMRDEPRRR